MQQRVRDQVYLELARRQRDEKIRYFKPHGGQLELIKSIAEDDSFIVVIGAGNGWGKSEFVVALTAAIMWPELAPDHFTRYPIFKNWRHPKRARIISTHTELEEIGSIQTAIKKLFPKDKYKIKNKGRHYPSEFRSNTGWVLDLMTYDQDVSEFAGPNIGLTLFNEPPPEDIYKESIARTRNGGIVIMAMTSLNDNPWVVDGILNKSDGKKIKVRYGSSCENCKQHGTDGNLEHEQIEKILSMYDADEREARFTGKPLSLSGRIYKTFDYNIHVAKEEIQPPNNEDISIGMVCDPAIGKPLAMLWRWVDRTGTVHYYDEYPEFSFNGAKDSNLTVRDYAELIKRKETINKAVNTRILDRHFGNIRRTLGGKTLKEEFAEFGIEFIDSYSLPAEEVETGILKVKEYLRYDNTKPIDNINRPKIIISPKCKNLIDAFRNWGRDPKNGKPKEDYKDFMDLVRYDLMSNPAVEDNINWNFSQTAHYGVNNA